MSTCTCVPRPLLVSVFVLLCLVCLGQRREVREYYADGRPKLYRTEVTGLAEGEWLEWYPNGTLRYRAGWRAGKGYGLWEYFYPDGQLRSETVYIDDLPTGIERAYHPSGVLARETVYLEGRRHGTVRTYDPTGVELTRQLYLGDTIVLNEPRLFAPGVISKPETEEYAVAFSPDGQTLYLTRREQQGVPQKIYRSEWDGDVWSEPVVEAFSTDTDEGANLSKDGEWLYFASYRPLPGRPPRREQDMNLWRVARSSNGWGEPEPLGPSINRVMAETDDWPISYEAGPSSDPRGNLYYWSGLDTTQGADVLYAPLLANGNFGAPSQVPDINTTGSESGPAISPDGQILCFSAYQREDGYGSEDLYCARREGDAWGEAVNLGPVVNTVGNEAGVGFSANGRYFYFSRSGPDGMGADIYYMETAYLSVPPK